MTDPENVDQLEATFKSYSTKEYRVKAYDNLSVKLNSLEENTLSFVNKTGNSNTSSAQGTASQFYLNGYLINEEGFVNLPLIGNLKVEGMTVSEIEEIVETKLKEYFKFVSVSVKLLNFRVTVLGEVTAPGVQYVFEKKITLFQALSNAGDLTDYANRKKIKLVREQLGQIKTTIIDISDPNIVSSDYFFLQPNDMIYVEPVKAKSFKINSPVLSVSLSVLSILLVFVNLLNN